MAERICAVDGCETGGRLMRGWCSKHYYRWYRQGDPLATQRIVGDDVTRLSSYTEEVAGGCWLWTGNTDTCGYGRIRVKGRLLSAHRLSYELHVGEIPSGMELDHLCRNPPCVNPDHLEPVTHEVNVQRGDGGRMWREKTHCPQGHPYEGANLYVSPSGYRHCRECERVRRRKAKRAKRSAASHPD